MIVPVIAAPTPGPPLSHSMTKAAAATRIASSASASAAPKVTSTGTISSAPHCSMTIASTATSSEKIASRRAQMASCETGSSTIRRRVKAIVIAVTPTVPSQVHRYRVPSSGE